VLGITGEGGGAVVVLFSLGMGTLRMTSFFLRGLLLLFLLLALWKVLADLRSDIVWFPKTVATTPVDVAARGVLWEII